MYNEPLLSLQVLLWTLSGAVSINGFSVTWTDNVNSSTEEIL